MKSHLDKLPFERITKLSLKGKQEIRDKFTPDEFAKLLAIAGDRKVVYLAAVLTGLRRSVLYKLQWCHVHVEGGSPVFKVPASIEQNESENHKFIRDDLWELMLQLPGAAENPKGRIFEGLLPKWGVEFLHNDMKKAGIEPERPDGKVLVFHSFRHTACNWGCQTGMGQKDVQSFMNHKTSNQVERYAHLQQMASKDLIEKLPRFDDQLKNGTHIGTQKIAQNCNNVIQSVTPENQLKSDKPFKTNKKTALTGCQSGSLKVIPTGFEPVFPG